MAEHKKPEQGNDDAPVLTSQVETVEDRGGPGLGEYADAKGNTWQLDAADAKRLGYSRVENKAVTAAEVQGGNSSEAKVSNKADDDEPGNDAVSKPVRGRAANKGA